MNIRDIYCDLFEKKYPIGTKLIEEAMTDMNHHLWGACRDCAEDILLNSLQWKWLAYRVDDFGDEVTRYMVKKLPIWYWQAFFDRNALSKMMDSTEKTVIWVINRWIAMLRNLFDSRYKFHLKPSYIVPYEEEYIYG